MTSWILAAIAAVAIAPAEEMRPLDRNLPVVGLGLDRSPGVLVNCTVGMDRHAPPDPARPTIVVVHGINAMHPIGHLELAERYGEAVGARWGASINVLGWNWNGNSREGFNASRNENLAVNQGRKLATALCQAGIAPESVHLVGQSSGGIVTASAARTTVYETGRRVGCLTLLDPVGTQHQLLFEVLHAQSAAVRVEHYWVTGPTGFGRSAPYAGVLDVSLSGPARWGGFVRPGHLDHLHAVRWHIARVAENPWRR